MQAVKGSARVSRVGEGVPRSRTSLQRLFRRDAETSTRDACATRNAVVACMRFLGSTGC